MECIYNSLSLAEKNIKISMLKSRWECLLPSLYSQTCAESSRGKCMGNASEPIVRLNADYTTMLVRCEAIIVKHLAMAYTCHSDAPSAATINRLRQQQQPTPTMLFCSCICRNRPTTTAAATPIDQVSQRRTPLYMIYHSISRYWTYLSLHRQFFHLKQDRKQSGLVFSLSRTFAFLMSFVFFFWLICVCLSNT